MSNETTENFIKVMSTFEWPDPVSVSYRLYYNDDGTPKCYAMEDLPGKYIEVDQEIYALRPWNVLVKNNQLIVVEPKVSVQKLVQDQSTGTACCPQDICVVTTQDRPHIKWKKVTNEID